MLNAVSRIKKQIKRELEWADLLMSAAAGDEKAYKKLFEAEGKKRVKKRH